MVAMTSLATVVVMVVTNWNSVGSLYNLILMVACSGTATIFVLSHLHSELKERESGALSEARTDPLTGLPNRKALIEALDRTIGVFQTTDTSSCLVFLDLNDFKTINDTLGHEMGDKLLSQVAGRLRSKMPSNQIFRLGGDEFALIFEACSLDQTDEYCRELLYEITGTYVLDESRAGIGCSMGIAQIEDDLTSSDLMRRSDLAMYKAKRSRTFVEVFDQTMLAEVIRKTELSERLRVALEDGSGIALKYQPIFSRNKRISALEVYFRWHDEEFGTIPPREAVEIARLTQQIDNLSLFVAGEASGVIDRIPEIVMCINIEATQILDTHFPEALERVIAGRGLSNSSFQLEIDESEIVTYGLKIAAVLKGLAGSGFLIAVDNYGSSNSSLTELKSLGVTVLKLDGSVLDNAREAGNISVLRAKVQLASALGMKVTCKGIGDNEDEAIALQAGCDYFQGFKYGRPDNANAFVNQSESISLSAAR